MSPAACLPGVVPINRFHYDRDQHELSCDASDLRDVGLDGDGFTIRGRERSVHYRYVRTIFTGAGEDREPAAYIFHAATTGDPSVRLWND